MSQRISYAFLFIAVLITTNVFAQNAAEPTDKVIKNDGTTIPAILLEVTPDAIKYKKASYPKGPTYTVLLKDVKKLILATGEEEEFNVPESTTDSKEKTPANTKPFAAEKFLTYSEDGKSILTDMIAPDDQRYLCVWTPDLELIKKIPIARYWRWYSQQIANDGSYLEKSVYYNRDGKELLKFKQKFLGVNLELSGWDYPAMVSPTGKRFLVNEHGTDKTYFNEIIYLFDENGKILEKYKNSPENFLFSHTSDLFYITKTAQRIVVHDSYGKETGTIKVKSLINNVNFFLQDRTLPKFSFDDKYIITRNDDSDVLVADINGNEIRHFYHPMPNAVAFSRDGQKIATAGNTYFGNSQKIDDENGNKIDYSGGSIKVWSFDGKLIKEINFPAKVSYLEFTPDNKGLALLIGDIGSPLWLWEKNNYELPEGYYKTIEDIAKYQAEKRDAAVKESRLGFWVDMTVNTANALAVGGANVAASKNRLLTQQQKAFAMNDAIAKRNGGSSTSGCKYEFVVTEFYNNGKLSNVTVSNVYTVPSSHISRADPAVTSGGEFKSAPVQGGGFTSDRISYINKYYVHQSLSNAKEERENKRDSYSVEAKLKDVADQCSGQKEAKAATTTSSASSSGCKFEFMVTEHYTNGKLSAVNISNVYSVPSGSVSHADPAVTSGGEFKSAPVQGGGVTIDRISYINRYYVHQSLSNAKEEREDKKSSYNIEPTYKDVGNKCN